ncbi:hypothetical protein EDB19DRAFT_639144 [Suillus lakei]|nr:hypothetical protein EDB19DRAFT_639144 [Suillus lakei]
MSTLGLALCNLQTLLHRALLRASLTANANNKQHEFLQFDIYNGSQTAVMIVDRTVEANCSLKKKATVILPRVLKGSAPSAQFLGTLLQATTAHARHYDLYEHSCYWYSHTIFEALRRLFPMVALTRAPGYGKCCTYLSWRFDQAERG